MPPVITRMRLCKFNSDTSINVDGAVLYGTALFLCRAMNTYMKEQKSNLDEDWLVELNIPESGDADEVRYRFYTTPPNPNLQPVIFKQITESKKKHVIVTMNDKSLLALLDSVLHHQLYLPDETISGDATVVQMNIQEDGELEVRQALCSVARYTEKKKVALKMARLPRRAPNKTAILIPYKVFLDYMKELLDKFVELKAAGYDLKFFVFDLVFTDSYVPSQNHFQFSINPKNPESLMTIKKKWANEEEIKLESYTISMTLKDFENFIMPAYRKINKDIRAHSFLQKDALMMVVSEGQVEPAEIENFYKEKCDLWN